MIPDQSSRLTSSHHSADERDHCANNVAVPDAIFPDDHAARHLSCSVSNHHDGNSVFVRLAKEAIICVQLRDDQFLYFLSDMRMAFSSSSNAMATPRSVGKVGMLCSSISVCDSCGSRTRVGCLCPASSVPCGSSTSATSLVNTSLPSPCCFGLTQLPGGEVFQATAAGQEGPKSRTPRRSRMSRSRAACQSFFLKWTFSL